MSWRLTCSSACDAGRTLGRIVLVAAFLAGAGFSAPARGQSIATFTGSASEGLGRPDAVPGEILVRYKPGVQLPDRANARAASRVELVRTLRLSRLELVRTQPGQSVDAAIRALTARPDVLYAEPNFLYEPHATPNDTRFGELWGLHNTGQIVNGTVGAADADIDAPEAWDLQTGSALVIVAVLDTGFAYDHPDIATRVWNNPGESGGGKETNGMDDDGNGAVDDHRGYDFVADDNDPRDGNNHGTHVSGTIGAFGNDGVGVAGVNWNVTIMPVQVCRTNCPNSAIIDGITYAAENGAHIVNMSLGGTGFSQAQFDAIAAAPNVLFAVSAGNSNSNNDFVPTYPCNNALDNILCVAASTQTDARAAFSNFGATSVDLAAPGTNILSSVAAFETILFDDFEGAVNWDYTEAPGAGWERTSETSFSPTRSIADSAGGSYGNGADVAVTLANPFDLSGRVECRLHYRLRLDIEYSYDFFRVEAATSAAGPFTSLNTWTGSTGGDFFLLTSDLRTFEGQSSVFLRFRLTSDTSVTGPGAHVDDVRVQCPITTYAGTEYAFFNGTSMASPHVAGAAALLKSSRPAASVSQLKQAILGSVDAKPAFAGITVTGGRLNLNAALAAINAAVAGPEPTTTALLSSVNPSGLAQLVSFTATVGSSSGTPQGDVVFQDGATILGTVPVNGAGVAQHSTSSLLAGDHSITAHYQGSVDHGPSSSSAIVQTVHAFTLAQRTFVSAAAGNDANPCTRALPCRSFAAALIRTNGGGEVVALDSGGFGPVTIGQSVALVAPAGVHAAITALSGNAVHIAAPSTDVVILRGFYMNGLGGVNGIEFAAGKSLHVENCQISGFLGAGVLGQADGSRIFINDTVSRQNGQEGFRFSATTGIRASLDSVHADENIAGVSASSNALVTVSRSVAAGNDGAGFDAAHGSAVINLVGCTSTMNGTGVHSAGTARARDSMITGNTTGVANELGAITISFGNNGLHGNGTDGSFTTTVAQQ